MPRKNHPPKKRLVRSSGTGPKIGQKGGPMESPNTRRNRTRSDQKRRAIEEEKTLRGYKGRPGRGQNGESSN